MGILVKMDPQSFRFSSLIAKNDKENTVIIDKLYGMLNGKRLS